MAGVRGAMGEAARTAADVAKFGFYVQLRRALNPENPKVFRALHSADRLVPAVWRSGRSLTEDELLRSGLEPQVDRALRIQYRVAVTELALGRFTRETLQPFVQVEGRHHLDAALALGKGVVWVYPHAGAVMLMLVWLVKNGYPYTQYAARGLAPKDVAEAHGELLGHNRWRQAVRDARERDEDQTGGTFLSLSQPARELYRTLARNELVGIAFDGRIGNKWQPYTFLGRQALINPGAWRLAASTGAMLVPCYNTVPDSGPALCTIGEAIDPKEVGADQRVLRFVEEQIRRSPAEYAPWLLHCRLRNTIDDHPLFTDQAEDDRWRKWIGSGTGR